MMTQILQSFPEHDDDDFNSLTEQHACVLRTAISDPAALSVDILLVNRASQERPTAQEAMAHEYFRPVR